MTKTYKFVIVGENGVGKSSIAIKYTKNEFFIDNSSTIGVDLFSKIENNIKINIWDTAGACRFRSITSSFFRMSDAAIIVYDITNKYTFENISYWLEQANDKIKYKSYIFLVGNKNDIEENREVSTLEGQNFANEQGLKFFEVSAKNGNKINEMFSEITTIIKKPEECQKEIELIENEDKCFFCKN